MLECALEAGVPAGWVTADEVYGGDPALRRWLEDRGIFYVLAVKGTEPLATSSAAGSGPTRASATHMAASVAAEQWVACSAGHGAKGRRLYDWARVELAAPAARGCQRWLLVRPAAATGSWPSTPATARPKLLARLGPGGRDAVGGGGGLSAGQE